MPIKFSTLSDDRVLAEIGQRLEQERLARDMTQAELADRSGVSTRTIKNVEAGKGCGLSTLIGLLRGLGIVDRLESLIPEQPVSPVQLAKLKGRRRKRASGTSGQRRAPSTDAVREKPWTWDE